MCHLWFFLTVFAIVLAEVVLSACQPLLPLPTRLLLTFAGADFLIELWRFGASVTKDTFGPGISVFLGSIFQGALRLCARSIRPYMRLPSRLEGAERFVNEGNSVHILRGPISLSWGYSSAIILLLYLFELTIFLSQRLLNLFGSRRAVQHGRACLVGAHFVVSQAFRPAGRLRFLLFLVEILFEFFIEWPLFIERLLPGLTLRIRFLTG